MTVPKADGSGSDTLTKSDIATNFTPSYKDNVNKGTATITLTAKETSKYSGKVTAEFTIEEFDLTSKNTQIKIDGQVYGGQNTQSFPYDGTGQDSVLQSIEVAVDIDGDGKFETKLTRNTDYVIDFTASTASGSSQNTTANGDKNGLNVTTDVGTVTLYFSGTGNYKSTKAFSAEFSITKATPNTPTAPTLLQKGDTSFTIDISDEDQRYTYEYMILTEDELDSAIDWEKATVITSSAVGTAITKKATKIDIETSTSGTSATSDYPTGCAIISSGIKTMTGKDLSVQSATKYYVVRKIAETDNVKGTQTSSTGNVTTKNRSLKTAVDHTNWNSSDNGTAGNIGGSAKAGLNKTYDGTAQKAATVILYADKTTMSTLREGTDYTVEYYNVPDEAAASVGTISSYATCVEKGRKNNTTDAGTVYIWAVGNENNYSDQLLIGFYVINKANIELTVENSSKDYDGSAAISDLKASGTFAKSGETVTVTNLNGVIEKSIVGTWGISSSDDDLTSSTATKYSDNASNFNISYNVADTKVTINKVEITISGSDITIYYGQKITIPVSTNVTEVSAKLQYSLTYAGSSSVADKLKIEGDGTTATLELTDYDSIKAATGIQITATLKDVQATENYTLGETAKTFKVTIKPADVQVGFAKDTDDDGVITLDSYTRRTEVKAAIETADDTALATTGTFAVGIDATGKASARKGELAAYNTTDTAYYVAPGSADYPSVVYKYYKADGVTELYDVPTADGTYIVKAYLKATDKYEGNVIGTDGSDSSKYSGTIKLVIGSGKSSSSSTGSSEGVSDYYENADDGKIYDKNDQLVTNQVVNLDGTDKYVGSDGKVVTGKVLVDDAATGNTYAIAKDGSLIKNNKTTIGGKDYVTDENGAIYKDQQLHTTPSGNQVYVGKDGAVVKNQVVTVNKKKYYANSTGRIVKNGFFNTKRGNKVYADKNGVLKVGVVFTVKGYKYYAGTNGAIATNGLTKTKSGNTVFATSSGKLKVNKTFTYKGVKYKANKKGVVTKVK
jgi:hypothetical protein